MKTRPYMNMLLFITREGLWSLYFKMKVMLLKEQMLTFPPFSVIMLLNLLQNFGVQHIKFMCC